VAHGGRRDAERTGDVLGERDGLTGYFGKDAELERVRHGQVPWLSHLVILSLSEDLSGEKLNSLLKLYPHRSFDSTAFRSG
jgi:hypothetical protein